VTRFPAASSFGPRSASRRAASARASPAVVEPSSASASAGDIACPTRWRAS
jgi:hypothetical protein